MSLPDPQSRPALATYEDAARLITHSLLAPEFSEDQVAAGCALAREYRVAAVMVRPSDVEYAARCLEGSGVALGSVAGYPHGFGTTAAKLYEARDLLRRGVKELDVALNAGKMISRQFPYIEMELTQLAQACHEAGAILTIVFENLNLSQDLKTIACRVSKRAEVDYASTSTQFSAVPYSLEDLALMRRLCSDKVKLKAGSGVSTLDGLLQAYVAGCDRVETIQTPQILDAWKAELARRKQAEEAAAPSSAAGVLPS